jgi:hypothetical protein
LSSLISGIGCIATVKKARKRKNNSPVIVITECVSEKKPATLSARQLFRNCIPQRCKVLLLLMEKYILSSFVVLNKYEEK